MISRHFKCMIFVIALSACIVPMLVNSKHLGQMMQFVMTEASRSKNYVLNYLRQNDASQTISDHLDKFQTHLNSFKTQEPTLASMFYLYNPIHYDTSPEIFSNLTCEGLDPFSAIARFIIDFTEQMFNEPPSIDDYLPEYDFIIVGAGSAGCILANRLTEIADWKVLLVEAGGIENYFMDIPLIVNYLQFTSANWDYRTQPSDKYCLGFKDRQCKWPRGKVMGGSSILNYMIFTRGAPQDYDNWQALGNEGWSWEHVLPYFKKIENYNIKEFYNDQYHSRDGYLEVGYAPFRTEMSNAWVQASQDYGFKYGDYNGADHISVSHLQLSIKDGTRHSSSRAYLHPITSRSNLFVSKESFVTKLLFDATKTRVTGVEIEKDGKTYKVNAKNEVILSAGTINSPQILMVSGIGQRADLKSVGVPVIKDLPAVGFNLKDHVATGGIQFLVNKQNVTLGTRFILTHPAVVLEFMEYHTGPKTVPGGCEAILFTNIHDKFNQSAWPDFELLFIGGGLNSDPLLRYNFNFDDEIFDKTYGPLGDSDAFMVFPMLMRPKSKGQVKLQSSDPHKTPIVIPNYFDDEEDMNKIVAGIKLAIEISKEAALTKIGAKLYEVPVDECLKFGPFGSDEYYKCQTRMFSFTIYHHTGTCKMGPDEKDSVVNSRLIVHGIKNLRVIDASVMPEIPSSHTNAPTYMIAEKGADMIKEDWKKIDKCELLKR